MVKQKQILGIIGMCFAIGGGIAWYFHQYLGSSVLWAIAGIILLRLNRRRNRSRNKS